MSEQNLSQWFNLAEQKPWEVGVYKTQDNDGDEYYNYWDGVGFHWGVHNACDAPMDARMDSSLTYTVKWRGLSTNPEVKKKPSGNRRVTRHIVKDWLGETVASFTSKKIADKYASRIRGSDVETIRFRTPE